MLRFATVFGLAVVVAACGSSGGTRQASGPRGDLMTRAEAGEAAAQYLTGYDLCCGNGGAEGRRDVARATVWLCRAARQGEPRAQFSLAMIYAAGLADSGIGTKLMRNITSRNSEARPALAAMWFDLAMAGGHSEAPTRRIVLGKNMSAADHLAAEKLRGRWRDAPCEWQAVYGAAAAR